MKTLPAESVHAVICDPPYNIDFLEDWDTIPNFQQWTEAWSREALRILKPGGHLLAFGATRQYHRMACGIEDAGFEIRDCLMWVYAQGFPKNHDISKAIDKLHGAERETKFYTSSGKEATAEDLAYRSNVQYGANGITTRSEPITDDAKAWEGWGTALKPAVEPIILARKPLTASTARNVIDHHTGGINIAISRIGDDEMRTNGYGGDKEIFPELRTPDYIGETHIGRWPTNVLFGHTLECTERKCVEGCAVEALERQIEGGERFFYCAKPSQAEREAGLKGEKRIVGMLGGAGEGAADSVSQRFTKVARNIHPTVKSIELMRYLVRLITPPKGIVLDCFLGSGSTGIAAKLENRFFIGIDQSKEYVELARQRIEHWEFVKNPGATFFSYEGDLE